VSGCAGRLPKSPERFELVDMGLTSATFSWLSDPAHTHSQPAYRLHYKRLSSDDNYSPVEVRYSLSHFYSATSSGVFRRICLSVCVFVFCLFAAYLPDYTPSLPRFVVHVSCGRRLFDGFDDGIFAQNGTAVKWATWRHADTVAASDVIGS